MVIGAFGLAIAYALIRPADPNELPPTAAPRLAPLNVDLGGAPFEAFAVTDQHQRRITFFLSRPTGAPNPSPLIVFVPGSGCHSAFRRAADGQVRGGYQNLLAQAARGRARVLVVEKPGVELFADPGDDGTALNCSVDFLTEHTLPRWADAIVAAVSATLADPAFDRARLLLVGHSEGGIVAARVAATFPRADIALLASNGPNQLYDLIERADTPRSPEESLKSRDARVRAVYATWQTIQADPDSVTRFAWGHPYRRWSSFLATSTIEELGRSTGRVFLAHGSRDTAVPISAFDALRDELTRQGRAVVAERRENADHSFRRSGEPPTAGMIEVFAKVLDWFFGSASAS